MQQQRPKRVPFGNDNKKGKCNDNGKCKNNCKCKRYDNCKCNDRSRSFASLKDDNFEVDSVA